MQSVYSFKLRGAYNKMAQLSEAQKATGVITASAGNHAQGVAISAQKLGIRATIVMGLNTPSIKVNAVRDRRGQSRAAWRQLRRRCLACQVPMRIRASDLHTAIRRCGCNRRSRHDWYGNSLISTVKPLDAIFIPVGGGGLVAGVAAYVKYLHPKTKIIGVEAEGSNFTRRLP